MNDTEIVQAAKTAKVWGTKFLPPRDPATGLFASVDMARVDLPSYHPRQWVVTLLAFQYAGGNVSPNLPSRNQTNTFSDFAVTVQWGVDVAQETAIVDYPSAGCSFVVNASTLQLTFIARANSTGVGLAVPMVGAFIAPVYRSSLGPVANPTFTDHRIIPTGTTAIFGIPARAVAYRHTVRLASAVAGQLVFIQTDDFLSATQADGSYPNAGLPDFLPTNTQGYISLHPRTQFVTVQNAGPTDQEVSMRYLLDMG